MLAAPSDMLCVIAVMLSLPAAAAVSDTDGIAEFRPVPIAFVASVPICDALDIISDCCACNDSVIALNESWLACDAAFAAVAEPVENPDARLSVADRPTDCALLSSSGIPDMNDVSSV